MWSARAVLLLFLCAVGVAQAEDAAYSADPLPKAAVERYLWVADPRPSDMLYLTELGRISDWDANETDTITDLARLE